MFPLTAGQRQTRSMMDFLIEELLDDAACLSWLEQRLHPDGLRRPRCRESQRRVAQQSDAGRAWRCKACDRYYRLLSGTVFEKTRQSSAKLVLLLRGIAKGEPTARLAGEFGIGRPRVHELSRQLQRNLLRTRPTEPLPDKVLEANQVYQNAGGKKLAAPRPQQPAPQTRQQATRARQLRLQPARRSSRSKGVRAGWCIPSFLRRMCLIQRAAQSKDT